MVQVRDDASVPGEPALARFKGLPTVHRPGPPGVRRWYVVLTPVEPTDQRVTARLRAFRP